MQYLLEPVVLCGLQAGINAATAVATLLHRPVGQKCEKPSFFIRSREILGCASLVSLKGGDSLAIFRHDVQGMAHATCTPVA